MPLAVMCWTVGDISGDGDDSYDDCSNDFVGGEGEHVTMVLKRE